MKQNDYRKRFYDIYMSAHWQYINDVSPESFILVSRVFRKHLSALLPKDKKALILDVACGPGYLLRFLQEGGYDNSFGIDLGDEQLAAARKMGVKNLEKADSFEYLKSEEKKFDMIIVMACIEHFKKEEALEFLDMAYNALKDNGRIIISTSNVLSLFNLESTFGDFTHELVFCPRSLAQLMRVCKFKDIQVRGMNMVVYDLRSGVRAVLWFFLKAVLRICKTITYGAGRGGWKSDPIFEPMILGIGQK